MSEQIPHGGRFIDLSGQEFGVLTALNFSHKGKASQSVWNCRCNLCGKIIQRDANNLKRHNYDTGCGCNKSRIAKLKSTIHGWGAPAQQGKTYRALIRAKDRTKNKNNPSWNRYGGRGIVMCEGFSAKGTGFPLFLRIVGPCPHPSWSLGRIENDGNYSCGECPECLRNGWKMNVRWESKAQQNNNRSNNHFLEWNGVKKTISQWALDTHQSPYAIHHAIGRGKPIEQILGIEPLDKSDYLFYSFNC